MGLYCNDVSIRIDSQGRRLENASQGDTPNIKVGQTATLTLTIITFSDDIFARKQSLLRQLLLFLIPMFS
jgi:hypothetical protein